MRVIVKEYATGGHAAFELNDDGRKLLATWAGPKKVGERICCYVEATCQDTPAGYQRLLETLAWLGEEIEKRKSVSDAV